jgi:hypothetical protein
MKLNSVVDYFDFVVVDSFDFVVEHQWRRRAVETVGRVVAARTIS